MLVENVYKVLQQPRASACCIAKGRKTPVHENEHIEINNNNISKQHDPQNHDNSITHARIK
jgi:hypothetical protein